MSYNNYDRNSNNYSNYDANYNNYNVNANNYGGNYGNYDGSYNNNSGTYRQNEYFNPNALSERGYNLVIGGTLLYGFLINSFMVKYCYDFCASFIENNPLIYFICYFVMIFAGWTMIKRSNSTALSFAGYNLIVIPLGIVLTIIVNSYVAYGYSNIVSQAFAITAIVTMLMMLAGSFFPEFFLSIGRTLGITLIITLVVELIMYFIGFDLGIIDYAVVLLFCGYIGFDWSRANNRPRTFYDGVDSAAELYVDIVNLFIRLLRILSRINRD